MPEPLGRLNRWELTREQQQREAEAIITPASKADVSRLTATVSQLKAKLHSLSGRSESVSSGTARRAESAEEYAQNYGDSSVHLRHGGGYIVRGPY